jgi:hypothetical protein
LSCFGGLGLEIDFLVYFFSVIAHGIKRGEDETRQGKKRTRDGGGRERGGGGAKDQTKEPKTKDLRKGPADGKRQKSKLNHVGLLFVRVAL